MKELLYPPYLQWEVTSECNHNCLHCYNYWRKDEGKKEKVGNHLNIAKKIVECHPVSVVITGGEPLLEFDSIKSSLELLKENNILLSMNTNAVLVTEEIAEFLAKMQIGTFVSLPCCNPNICDTITNVKGSLERIEKGIKTLKSHGVRVTVNMVVSKRNIDYIFDTAKYAKDVLSVNRFFASRVSKPINSSDEFTKELLSKEEVSFVYDQLIRISNELGMETDTATPTPACMLTTQETFDKFAYKRNCTAGKTSYGLDCSGNIKACPRDEQIYGNILVDDFHEVWKKMEDWRNETFLPKDCKECNVKNLCNGGCRLDAYPLTGKRDSLDPLTCLENLPVKLETNSNEDKEFSEDVFFDKIQHLRYVEESCGWRISNGKNFMIITEELKNFLSSHESFSIKDFRSSFDVSYSLANKVVNVLLGKNIIREYKHN